MGKNSQVINIFFYVELFLRSVFSVPFFFGAQQLQNSLEISHFLLLQIISALNQMEMKGKYEAPESCKITLRN